MRLAASLALMFSVAAGCASAPRGVDDAARPATAEALAGRTAASTLEGAFGGVVRDEGVERELSAVAVLLLGEHAPLAWQAEIRVLAAHEVNAFSLPPARIYITRGLLCKTRDDPAVRAAVVAHEAAHLIRGDSLTRCTPAEALSRELATDALADRLMRRAGVDPRAPLRLHALIAAHQPPAWAHARQHACQARICDE